MRLLALVIGLVVSATGSACSPSNATDAPPNEGVPLANAPPKAPYRGPLGGTPVIVKDAALGVRAGEGIQAAVDRAKDGDVIRVAAGTFLEDIVIQGKSITLLGGFAPDFVARDLRANETILQGSGTQAVVRVLGSGKINVVDGFTIRGGGGNPEASHSGAGIYFQDGDATFSNNHIVDNRPRLEDIHMSDTRGGGIVANGYGESRVQILNNVIEGNASGRGAGIASSGLASVLIEGNTIRNNRGYSDLGGGLFIDSPDARILHNTIAGNEIGPLVTPYGWGGGVYLHGTQTNARLAGNVIANNRAVTAGSGVFVDDGAHASLSHEVIYKNHCTQEGGAAILVSGVVTIDQSTVTAHACVSPYLGDGVLTMGSGSRATVSGSIFFENGGALQFNFGRAAEGPPLVNSSWTEDPLFVNPAADEFRLKSGSPASGYGAF